jgi:hypothetical protein
MMVCDIEPMQLEDQRIPGGQPLVFEATVCALAAELPAAARFDIGDGDQGL